VRLPPKPTALRAVATSPLQALATRCSRASLSPAAIRAKGDRRRAFPTKPHGSLSRGYIPGYIPVAVPSGFAMLAAMTWAALPLLFGSYLIGAIPFGLLAARLKGVDIRAVGSGNIGATNVFRAVSKPLGLFVFFLDALKGFGPAFVFPALVAPAGSDLPGGPGGAWALAFGAAAIAGHNWPVFLRFRGGKGVATSAGVLLAVAPLAVLIGLAAWILLLLLTGYVAIASMGAGVAIAIYSWLVYAARGLLLPAAFTLLALLVAYTHRSNIQRLRAGTEHRFRFRRRVQPQSTQRNAEEITHGDNGPHQPE
jgi:glycerol-3-phosphate acyltransferase PlsY